MYLDNDMIVAGKLPLDDEHSYGAMNFESRVNPGFMKFTPKHPLLELVMADIVRSKKKKKNYCA